MTFISNNPNYLPFESSDIPIESIGERLSELMNRADELERLCDSATLCAQGVNELADIRMRLTDYAIADTIRQFDLDIKE